MNEYGQPRDRDPRDKKLAQARIQCASLRDQIKALKQDAALWKSHLNAVMAELKYQECNQLHHAKPDQGHGDTCPVAQRVNHAIYEARLALDFNGK